MNMNFMFIYEGAMLSGVLPVLLAMALGETASSDFVLYGHVADPTGAPVVDARVAAVPSDARPAAQARTDAAGAFSLTLSRGVYRVTIAAAGFADEVSTVIASADEARERQFVLKLPGHAETVTVHAPGGYDTGAITSATRTLTLLRDVPQSVTVTTKELIRDQLMLSMGDVMRYTPGIQVHQGENNRDQVIIRGNSSSADFFLDGVRDDVQYYRDLYNVERIEALKGPNAVMFGRGGGGGVVNRVTKEAIFAPVREVTLQGGEFGHKRVAGDFDKPLGEKLALRLNGMYEDSDSFRDFVDLERWGVNPTLTFAPDSSTSLTLGYEHLHDVRVADRGITSYQGRPADAPISTYYGNPDDGHVRARVDLVTATVEHRGQALTVRNRTIFGAYDRFYQNYVPGAVNAAMTQVSLSAYNNDTARQNLFSQTDFVHPLTTGRLRHTLLAGFELGNQDTDNFRNTGYFGGGVATTLSVPYADPTLTTVTAAFRQSATDADNHLDTHVGAAYVQDQVELSRHLQAVGGLRFDRFDLTYRNKRNGDTLSRVDDLFSPRVGLVYKPAVPVSIYSSYTVSWLPSSGDQFSSLTVITRQVEPEKFQNYEVGAKWEPHAGLALTSALYRLDRTNTRSTDPNDPTRIVQTGSQRTNGFEVGLAGRITSRWQVAGGYAWQHAYVTSATAAARQGADVAQVPRHTLSLWNQYRFLPRLSAAVGVLYRTDMFAAIDNTVTLPGYTRVDVAAYYALGTGLRLQANLENALGRTYWTNADSNTNISPGAGRTLRAAVAKAF